jgi:hypothetical protein
MKKLTATQRMIEGDAKIFIEYCRILFEEENNPLFAWQAYQVSQEFKVMIPWWVLDYFDEVAKNLLNPSQTSADGRAGTIIQEALLMKKKGRGSVFLRYADFYERWDALNQVRELLENGETLDNAFDKVSKKIYLSKEAIRKWYYSS